MTIRSGLCPAMLTAWGRDELFDSATSERYIRWLIDNGVQALSTCGSTGENTAQYTSEQKQIIEHVVKYVAGEVPVYAGTGKYSTLETIDLTSHAQAVGVDGVLIILPYYFKPYNLAAMNHFRAIRRAVEVPIILYNNPNFAGYELSTPEVKQLVDEGVIQAVKAAHGDPERVSDLKFTCGDVLTVFYGHDYAAFQGYAAGADGWLSGFPAAFPKQCRQLQDAIVVDGDLKKARRIWEKFIPFVDFFMDPEVNQRAHWLEMLKWAVTVQGVDIGVPRRPLGPLDEAIRDRMQAPLEVLLG